MTDPATTDQLGAWTSAFGREYTDRNTMTADQMDQAFVEEFGVRKSVIYRELVGPARIAAGDALEVGCNIGLQLELLGRANPGLRLHGVEPQSYAIERARTRLPAVTLYQANAFRLPLPDGSMDLVMTNGVLIHIHPDDLGRALSEIHRVASRFIFCHEYYAPDCTEVGYRGHDGLLWKTDFAAEYARRFPDLRQVDVRYYPFNDAGPGAGLVDQVALFQKGG
jgi:pseudaminic acid biosynthesis-associated methylase